MTSDVRIRSIAVVALALAFGLACASCGDDDAVTPPGTDAGPAPDDSPWKGPWSLRIDETHATVRWETRLAPATTAVSLHSEGGTDTPRTVTGTSAATEVTASFGVGSTVVPMPDYAGTYYMNEVAIDGLTAGTCYVYEVAGYPTADGRFCTMRAVTDTAPIRFLVVGDTSPSFGKIMPILSHVREHTPLPDFTIHVGDIEYYAAVIETWQRWFAEGGDLVRIAGFFPTMGNHEYELDGAEFDQYTERFFGHAGLDGDTDRYHFTSGGVHFFTINTQNDVAATSEQMTWLASALAAAHASPGFRFSVVFFHKPTYTVGDTDPRLDLRASLEPLLAPNEVRLVLAGHMHGYERFEVGDVTYITTAGGGGVIGDVDANVARYPEDAALRVASGHYYHAMLFTIDGTSLTGEVIDDEGVVQDTFTHAVP